MSNHIPLMALFFAGLSQSWKFITLINLDVHWSAVSTYQSQLHRILLFTIVDLLCTGSLAYELWKCYAA